MGDPPAFYPFTIGASVTHRTPFEHDCDCRCLVHHGYRRTTFNDEGCACAITCATQPMTLLAEQWGCALFLDLGGDLWHVNQLVGGEWDWNRAAEIGRRSDHYQTRVVIEQLLRQAALVLHASTHS